jgi:hypothetical protein
MNYSWLANEIFSYVCFVPNILHRDVTLSSLLCHFDQNRFTQQQAEERYPLFHFAVSEGPHVLIQCIAFNINFNSIYLGTVSVFFASRHVPRPKTHCLLELL